jgi:hypothetical protein
MGRWSELSWVRTDQVREGRRWAGTMVKTWEELGLLENGRRVGRSALRTRRVLDKFGSKKVTPGVTWVPGRKPAGMVGIKIPEEKSVMTG